LERGTVRELAIEEYRIEKEPYYLAGGDEVEVLRRWCGRG